MKKLILGMILLLWSVPAHAWWPAGHSILTRAAIQSTPAEMPQWFRAGEDLAAHCVQDPDVHKNRDLPALTAREAPEHFFDFELLRGHPVPPSRAEFIKLCAQLKEEPSNVGFAPYAIAEWTERLTISFAEARRWPDNKLIQTKAMVYAGILSHYAEDLGQPLHTTVDFDGKTKPDGTSPKTGIHAKVDSLIEKFNWAPERFAVEKVEPFPDLWKGIEAQLQESRAAIGATYALEDDFPPEKGAWKPRSSVEKFALERGQQSARFTAQLYFTAWRNSAKIKLPSWLEREKTP